MLKFKKLFPSNCSVIAMVHAGAFPGTPSYGKSIEKIIKKACTETEIYLNHGVDGILVENMHDNPYIQSKHFGPETAAVMTRICTEVKKIVQSSTPCGVQILTAGNKEAIAVAQACEFDFIRAEGFVFSHIGDEGFIDANAGLILRYRRQIEAENVSVFTDIKKKHSSHAITTDVSLVETAKAAEYFLSDGVILTGSATGEAANVEELTELKTNCSLPVIIGSGITKGNVHHYIKADAFIIGSHFKNKGHWKEDVSSSNVKLFMEKVKSLRTIQIN